MHQADVFFPLFEDLLDASTHDDCTCPANPVIVSIQVLFQSTCPVYASIWCIHTEMISRLPVMFT